jgi:hypothetical protein
MTITMSSRMAVLLGLLSQPVSAYHSGIIVTKG